MTALADPPAPPDRGLLEVLASVPDPRDPRGLRYPMSLLLAIAVLATTAGMRGFAGYATWARTAPADLLAELGLTKPYRPSDKTFRRVLALIDPADLDRRLGAYFTTMALAAADTPLLAVAIDRRTLLRGGLRDLLRTVRTRQAPPENRVVVKPLGESPRHAGPQR